MLYGRSFDGKPWNSVAGAGWGTIGSSRNCATASATASYTDSAWTWEEWVIPSVSSKDTRQRAGGHAADYISLFAFLFALWGMGILRQTPSRRFCFRYASNKTGPKQGRGGR